VTVVTTGRARLLVLVVAYNAETTLSGVLGRIPARLFEDYRCEVLVLDDASDDATFALGQEHRDTGAYPPITLARNPTNLGYGGNQKVGYAHALAGGFDLVALVHGDGQYAPEALPRLLAPLREGRADVVLGSRMMIPGAARSGGMPLYKSVGNRILTGFQNTLLRTRFSELHSGYRLYTVAALRGVEFGRAGDGFGFDTHVFLQLLGAGARIVELPIPTHYGEEICRVNGMRYAADVVRATTAYALATRGGRPRPPLVALPPDRRADAVGGLRQR
jgi:glycosyltransferase involved in cell wall biosynthesis